MKGLVAFFKIHYIQTEIISYNNFSSRKRVKTIRARTAAHAKRRSGDGPREERYFASTVDTERAVIEN